MRPSNPGPSHVKGGTNYGQSKCPECKSIYFGDDGHDPDCSRYVETENTDVPDTDQ